MEYTNWIFMTFAFQFRLVYNIHMSCSVFIFEGGVVDCLLCGGEEEIMRCFVMDCSVSSQLPVWKKYPYQTDS